MSIEQQLIEKWRNLPLDKQQQVLRFIEYLEEQTSEKKESNLRLRKREFIIPNGFNKQLPDEILD